MDSRPFAVFCAEKEKMLNHGEDAFSYSFINDNIGYIGTYDGCGGMGAKKYSLFGERTGARIASLCAGYVTDDFYNKNLFRFDGTDSERIKKRFRDLFFKVNEYLKSDDSGIKISGSLFKSIPTTASIVAIRNNNNKIIECEYMWAGDSRGYFMDNNGICQVTKDDLDTDEDAFTNLRSDARMSNVINADNDFVINQKIINVHLPAVIITSTDGGFAYFSTPMEFEWAILNSLFNANDIEGWRQNIYDYISEYSGDDFSIIIAVYGFNTFEEIKVYFYDRFKFLYQNFISRISSSDEETLKALWELYSHTYYRSC